MIKISKQNRVWNVISLHKRKAVVVAVLILVSWYISTFWIQLMLIRGESMEPNYHDWQFVALDKQFREIRRGEVYACKCEPLKAVIVKRVIAVPGDTIQIRGNSVYVNDCLLPDTEGKIAFSGIAGRKTNIPKGKYFVMGDNFNHSKDSRYEEIGLIARSDFSGRVIGSGKR